MTKQRQRFGCRIFLPGLIILYGGFLRFWEIDKNLIFGDEIHTLKYAAEKSFSWIFTHFAIHDACIPLTLYNKLLIETIGLNEWGFRMPSLICGMALLFGVYRFMEKRFLFAETILVTGILSVSPYFVYMSREARPYIIITLLIWIAFVLVMRWRVNHKASEIIPAFAVSSLAVYFHPVVLPAVIAIGMYPLFFLFYQRAPKQCWFQFAAAVLLFAFMMVLLMMPPAISLFDEISSKGAEGLAGVGTIANGLSLLPGLPVTIPIWLWAVLLIPGIISLYKRFPAEVLLILAAGSLQLAFLFAVQPRKMEIPWVWLRYVAHLLPWFMIAVVAGVISIISVLTRIRKTSPLLIAGCVAILVFFTAYHITKLNYGIFSSSSYNVHPTILMVDKDKSHLQNFTPVAEFYQNLPGFLSRGRIIESPMLFTFPLYRFYQILDGKNFQTAGVGSGYAQNLFNDNGGFKFKTIFPLSQDASPKNDHSFLIIHKRIGEEMVSAYQYFCKEDIIFRQLQHMEYLFAPKAINHMFGNKGRINPDDLNMTCDKVYEDKWLAVFDLNSCSNKN